MRLALNIIVVKVFAGIPIPAPHPLRCCAVNRTDILVLALPLAADRAQNNQEKHR
jgi:hypothetical protein